jgi:membrane protease YdiL (CAAX protease family)
MTLSAALFVLLSATVLVLRSGSVAGRWRIPPSEPRGALPALTLVALGAWILIPSILVASMQIESNATTRDQTAEQVSVPLSPGQRIVLSIAAAGVVSTILIGGNLLMRPGGLTWMGFLPSMLPRGLAVGIVASLLILPLSFLAAMLTDRVWDWMNLEHPGSHEMLQILAKAESPPLRVLIYLSAMAIAPVFEELLFRGHVQTMLVQLLTGSKPEPETAAASSPPPRHRQDSAVRWAAILITSGLFALVHGAFWMMPPIFFLSVCIGYVYERTGNLWAPVVVHMIFNTANVIVFVNLVAH